VHKENWDDLRIALLVAETGSVASAAKKLGVAHTTILRRIGAFEAATGAQLFRRTGRGYAINEDRAAAFKSMREARIAVERAWATIDAAALPPGDTLRLTSTDSLTTTILPTIAAELRRANPKLSIALLSINAHLNLAHGQADLTVRPAKTLPEDLEGVVVAEMAIAEYRAPGAPDDWVRGSGPLMRSPAARRLAEQPPAPGVQADSYVVMRELAAAGHGRTLLPCILGDADPRLVRAAPPDPELTVPVWVAGHRELADSSRICRLRRDLAAAFEAHRPALLGISASG